MNRKILALGTLLTLSLGLVGLVAQPALAADAPEAATAELDGIPPPIDRPVHFKRLAGPPEEFEAMSPPNPVDTGIHSGTALLSVELARRADGKWAWEGSIPIEREATDLFLLLTVAVLAAAVVNVAIVELQAPRVGRVVRVGRG
jgi:hypothetical protein